MSGSGKGKQQTNSDQGFHRAHLLVSYAT
jgi:hypothetical protein